MVESVNLSNFSVDESGRVRLNGVASGINAAAAIEGLLAARRITVDRVETEIDSNTERLTALEELRALIENLQNASDALRGNVSFDKESDLFESKQAFATTRRTDGGTASQAANLLGVTVSNAAQVGSHQIEILERASNHRVGMVASVTPSDNQGLNGTFRLKLGTDPFDATDKDIEIVANDSLYDIRDKINAANVGENGTGVTATVISVDATTATLVLTADDAGQEIAYESLTGDDILDSLTVTSGGTYANVLAEATTAKLSINNLTDLSAGYLSTGFTASTDVIGGGTLTFKDLTNADTTSLTITAGATLAQAAAEIDGQTFPGGNILRAATETQADGSVALRIYAEDGGANAVPIEIDFTGATATGEIGNNGNFARSALLVERTTNTIDDVVQGVTFDLFQAEPGTVIDFQIENDLAAINEAIREFVDAFNGLRQFLNLQRLTDPITGEPVEEAKLAGTRVVGDVESRLAQILATGAVGIQDGARVLREVGINIVDVEDSDSTASALNAATLEIDDTELEEALLTNFDEVRRLFAYQFEPSDSRVQLGAVNGGASYVLGGVDISFAGTNGRIDPDLTTISDGTFIAANNVMRILTGPAAGLDIVFSGDLTSGTATTVNINNSLGMAHQMFSGLDLVLDPNVGLVAAEMQVLEDENTRKQSNLDDQLASIDRERIVLQQRFARMEARLAELESLKGQVAAAFGESE